MHHTHSNITSESLGAWCSLSLLVQSCQLQRSSRLANPLAQSAVSGLFRCECGTSQKATADGWMCFITDFSVQKGEGIQNNLIFLHKIKSKTHYINAHSDSLTWKWIAWPLRRQRSSTKTWFLALVIHALVTIVQ